MSQLKVGFRLAAGFGLLLMLMLVAVLVGLGGIRSAEAQASRLESENVALLKAASTMQVAQLAEAIAVRDYVGLPDLDSQRAALLALKAAEKEYASALGELKALAAGSSEKQELMARVDKLAGSSTRIESKVHEALDLVDSAEYQQAQGIVYKDVRALQAVVSAELQGLAARAQVLAQQRARTARLDAQASELRLALTLAAALLLGVAATVLITRGIVRPLGVALQAAERVAGGDLTALQVRASRDETGRVLTALGHMQHGLNGLVRAVRVAADEVHQACAGIAGGNKDLSARTEAQAAALEETAASVEELTASVKQNTVDAQRGSELAREAAELANDSGSAVGDVVGSMQGIQKSARRVSDIVGMMDEIAFQTNLLALNAAVEAARAGEQGRGFGVVAAQVRALAQRSADAAKDIKQLAQDAVGQADTGARAATRAGETMDKVVRIARDVAEVVANIARAGEEQRSGIEQVNATIAQLDTATQGNASLVQEINGLTDALLAGAGDLVAAANRFRLDGAQEQPAESTGFAVLRGPAGGGQRPALGA